LDNGYSLFQLEAIQLIEQLPGFTYFEEDNAVPQIVGRLALADNQGVLIDTYDIRIVCTSNYPLSFPLVYETGGRIPINIDWHVYPDGHACINTIPEEIITCNKGITLKTFIEHQVKPYFFNQKYRELNGFFLNERAHGQQGTIDYFKEVFKSNNLRFISLLLLYIKSNPEPNRVKNCFCGSGIRYRKCHREAFRLFKPLSVSAMDLFVNTLISYLAA